MTADVESKSEVKDVALGVGSRCSTFAGRGTVIAVREAGMISVTLDWKLAQGQGATAHFNAQSVTPS